MSPVNKHICTNFKMFYKLIVIISIFTSITNGLDILKNFDLQQPMSFDEDASSRQLGIPSNPLGAVSSAIPCQCDKGICKCCSGSALSAIGLKSCLEITYIPEDFAFDVQMKMNSITLYRNKVSGKNPPPMCFRPPRLGFIRACLTFYDIYFIGQNMHVCMNIGGYLEGFEVFERSYDCLLFGNKGVKIVKPEQSYPVRPNDVEIDDDNEEIEDYDENVKSNSK